MRDAAEGVANVLAVRFKGDAPVLEALASSTYGQRSFLPLAGGKASASERRNDGRFKFVENDLEEVLPVAAKSVGQSADF